MAIKTSLKMLVPFLLSVLLFAVDGLAKDQIYTGFFSSDAVGGYDTVAYFTESRPVKGLKKYKYQYKGANWYFSSEDNLNRFKNNPERYAPQYGGYCAWAVAHGGTSKGDPLHWAIRHGKLYLNYNQSIQDKWQERADELIARADRNWPGVIQ